MRRFVAECSIPGTARDALLWVMEDQIIRTWWYLGYRPTKTWQGVTLWALPTRERAEAPYATQHRDARRLIGQEPGSPPEGAMWAAFLWQRGDDVFVKLAIQGQEALEHVRLIWDPLVALKRGAWYGDGLPPGLETLEQTPRPVPTPETIRRAWEFRRIKEEGEKDGKQLSYGDVAQRATRRARVRWSDAETPPEYSAHTVRNAYRAMREAFPDDDWTWRPKRMIR